MARKKVMRDKTDHGRIKKAKADRPVLCPRHVADVISTTLHQAKGERHRDLVALKLGYQGPSHLNSSYLQPLNMCTVYMYILCMPHNPHNLCFCHFTTHNAIMPPRSCDNLTSMHAHLA
jgi:hypothetical protein